jgi:hypothetical protein
MRELWNGKITIEERERGIALDLESLWSGEVFSGMKCLWEEKMKNLTKKLTNQI